MNDLIALFAVRAEDSTALLVFGLAATAHTIVMLIQPQLFLRGYDDPDLIPTRIRAYSWFYTRLARSCVWVVAGAIGIWARGGPISSYGIDWGRHDRTIIFLACFALFLLPAVMLRRRGAGFWAHYPEVRIRRWNARMSSNNRTTWFIYLGAYETFVRGFCLFALADWSSQLVAIVIVGLFDAGVRRTLWSRPAGHDGFSPQPPAETTIGLPLGLTLSVGSLWTGSLLGPWLAHLAAAMLPEILAQPAVAPSDASVNRR